MNRNTESRFAINPTIDIRRSQFKRPSRHLTTFNAGELVPIYVDEVLPGDTFKMQTSKLIRQTTSVHATMDNAYLDTYFFYVPSRILWEHWEQMNGANDQPWYQGTEYTVPQIELSGNQVSTQSLLDYFGIPAMMYTSSFQINALPIRAYYKIWNDYFRDENLQADCVVYTSDSTLEPSYYKNENNIGCYARGSCCHVSKFHDYFTSALPKPQKADDVIIPTGDSVVTLANDLLNHDPYFRKYDGSTVPGTPLYNEKQNAINYITNSTGGGFGLFFEPNGSLVANGFQITVNSLRLAMQTQKLFEKDARGGTRYNEILLSHFGVASPDSRLQRSEYLGGKRIPINMAEVVQNSSTTDTSVLGQVAGYSATGDNEDSFTKSFVEHGYIIGLCCVRSDHTYSQGLDKLWSKKGRFDYYWPVLANIGEQPILNKEIYVSNDSHDDEVFGYQEAWADYRYKQNRVSAYFRPTVQNTLASWTYVDKYNARPTLSSGWIQQGVDEINRTLVYDSSVAPQYIADFYFNLVCTRPMPLYSIPGYVDHF